jgi:hypothetical protein
MRIPRHNTEITLRSGTMSVGGALPKPIQAVLDMGTQAFNDARRAEWGLDASGDGEQLIIQVNLTDDDRQAYPAFRNTTELYIVMRPVSLRH